MGTIVTFYSYKGGVGRTMALANIATLLASRGKRILAIDWDLEAPGLDQYFSAFTSDLTHVDGLLDLLVAQQKPISSYASPDWQGHLTTVNLGTNTPICLMTSGNRSSDYVQKLSHFNLPRFFEDSGGAEFVERLRNEWKASFDITLIDSRTGLCDESGLCTILIPDAIVAFLTTNRQSVEGTREVLLRAQTARQRLSVDRMPLTVLPIVSRFDSRSDFAVAQEWLDVCSHILGEFYSDWLPRTYRARDALERTALPYVGYLSFGEQLPVITHGTSDPDGLGWKYNLIATLIANDFSDAAGALGLASPASVRASFER